MNQLTWNILNFFGTVFSDLFSSKWLWLKPVNLVHNPVNNKFFKQFVLCLSPIVYRVAFLNDPCLFFPIFCITLSQCNYRIQTNMWLGHINSMDSTGILAILSPFLFQWKSFCSLYHSSCFRGRFGLSVHDCLGCHFQILLNIHIKEFLSLRGTYLNVGTKKAREA